MAQSNTSFHLPIFCRSYNFSNRYVRLVINLEYKSYRWSVNRKLLFRLPCTPSWMNIFSIPFFRMTWPTNLSILLLNCWKQHFMIPNTQFFQDRIICSISRPGKNDCFRLRHAAFSVHDSELLVSIGENSVLSSDLRVNFNQFKQNSFVIPILRFISGPDFPLFVICAPR